MGQGGEVTASISVCGLTHRYASVNGALTVLDDVSLSVAAGGYAALTGPSGAGKTTLLSLLGGLEAVQQGVICVAGTELGRLSGNALAEYRRSTVGFVFQHFGLLDSLTALENIELARSLAGTSRRQRRREATELLDAVGLQGRHDHLPRQLSGGERQRVAIARAMANQPRVLLADEPTGNLDEESAATVIDLLESLNGEHGVTLVIVTHNRAIAERAATRLVLRAARSAVEPLARA